MSLILDALKRAERERAKSPLLSEPPPAAVAPAPARRPWRPIAIVVLVAVAGALAWTFLAPRFTAPEQAAEAPAPSKPAPVPAPAVIPGTESVASLDDITDAPIEEELSPAAPPRPQARPAPVETPPPAPPPRPAAEAIADPAPAAAEAPAPPAHDPPAAPENEPEPEAAPPAQIPPALTQPAPMRRFREMPPSYRADFPAITIEVHSYDADSARRMVMINGRRYRTGERMAEGPVILEIVRDGVVFEHRGERVLYPLGR